MKDYFIEVFAESSSHISNGGVMSQLVITGRQNNRLTAVKQMHPDKSSRPDGLNTAFFQHFWV